MTVDLVAGEAHDHVIAAVRVLLADGLPRTADELCALGIAQQLLDAKTLAKYVANAVRGFIGRQTLRGEPPDFVEVADGRFRLNVPLDPFPAHPVTVPADPERDAFCAALVASARRSTTPDPADGGDIGAAFERMVDAAMKRLGFISHRDGATGEPDVISIAPLGDAMYAIVFECKSLDGGSATHTDASGAAEAARFRDRIGAKYAVLIGAEWPDETALDDELAAHAVALWTADDLAALVVAHAVAPIAWPALEALCAPGRASARVADFVFEHEHGASRRARIALRLVVEEALRFQASLLAQDALVQRVDSPLTHEALLVLVNERLAAERAYRRL